MSKKSVILGLVLLVGGAALLGWVFAQRRREKQEQQERRERLRESMSKVDEVIGDEIDVSRLEGIVFEDDGLDDSAESKKREERREFVVTVAGVFTLTGGTILGWWLFFGTTRLFVRGFCGGAKSSTGLLRSREQTSGRQLVRPAAKGDERDSGGARRRKAFANPQQKPDEHPGGAGRQVDKHSRVLVDSGWQSFSKNCAEQRGPALSQTGGRMGNKASAQRRGDRDRKGPFGGFSKKGAKGGLKGSKPAVGTPNVAVLLSDEESERLEEPLKVETPELKLKTSAAGSAESFLRKEDSSKAQSENLERQMAEFKQMAQSVQQNAFQHSKPMEENLKELTQQVSAIREYAAGQQERVEKLQDGYDWNIIKNFCLRVIRCIDNLENRISRLSERKIDTADLEEVRDELVFALESTGVERFGPEINSDYRGQEKNTEAVKDKEKCGDSKLKGKIAKVIRRGYQYFVDEENVKIIRPAQVRLYG